MRILVFLIGSFLAWSLAVPASAGEATSPAGHVVRWDPGLDGPGREVLSLLPRIQAEVARRLGFGLPGGPASTSA